MNFTPGTDVYSGYGDKLGTVERVVIDPGRQEVTNLVVRKGTFFKEDKVIPVGLVKEATSSKVTLTGEIEDLNGLPPFKESDFVRLNDGTQLPLGAQNDDEAVLWYPPVVEYGQYTAEPPYFDFPMPPMARVEEKNIPERTIALKKHAEVYSADEKKLGTVEQIYYNEQDDKVTHFRVSKGMFFTEERIIPAYWVRSATDEEVWLGVTSQTFDQLPTLEVYSVRRS